MTYRYDALGRLRAVCDIFGERTDYALDPASNRTNYLHFQPTAVIPAGSGIYSPDGRFYLTMQTNGNLVHYFNGTPIWSSNTVGSGATMAVMQAHGNLVLYTPTYTAVWATPTHTHHCANLQVQNDGNVVIVNMDKSPVWATNTGGH